MRFKCIVLGFLFCLIGCGDNCHTKDTNYTEFSRFFMHLPGHYSVLANQDGQLVTIDLNSTCPNSCRNIKVKILTDVAAEKSMWFSRNGDNITVHLRNEKDVEGGSFKPGKAPTQQTIPIQ